jgi:hypothetical protein
MNKFESKSNKQVGDIIMQKMISLVFILLLIISGFGVSAFTDKNMNQSNFNDSFDMVIISPEMFSSELQTLIDHKNSIGIITLLKTTEEIYNEYEGRDYAEKIKYFIKDSIESYGVKYVLLVGGKEKLPVRYVTIHSTIASTIITPDERKSFISNFIQSINSDIDFISDLYYADIYNQDGSFCSWDSNDNNLFGEMNNQASIDIVDLYPEVYVGRILCQSPSDVEIVVNKIKQYETTTNKETWFNNLILCGGDTHPNFIEELFLLPLAFGNDSRMAWEGEYICNEVEKCLNDFQTKKIYASSLLGIKADRLTSDNINSAINYGAGFLLFALHGHTDRMATHFPFTNIWLPYPNGYHITEIEKLSNNDKLPIAVFSACLCGDFNSVESPIAWEIVQHDNGGAIASFALTTEGLVWPTTISSKTLSGHLTMSVFEAYSQGVDIAGEIWAETIVRYLDDEWSWSFNEQWGYNYFNYLTLEEWILLGDPSLKIGGYQ